ncbi:hypothetical protein GDO81_017599 [Engystomops pustulosus]|uniref:Uncharacterized protein n=1 Tax=Engystomops pustulosus TaxID=76066 RepID=A0AAV7A1C2_ENGPU|nr:hypothetical protein GDO81_017599 [Engystomops pustulosus]
MIPKFKVHILDHVNPCIAQNLREIYVSLYNEACSYLSVNYFTCTLMFYRLVESIGRGPMLLLLLFRTMYILYIIPIYVHPTDVQLFPAGILTITTMENNSKSCLLP